MLVAAQSLERNDLLRLYNTNHVTYNAYSLGSQWQFLSPYWHFEEEPVTRGLVWCLKDFGCEGLHLRCSNGIFEIISEKSWGFVQEELAGHIEMHLWCKKQSSSIDDSRFKSIQIELNEASVGLNKLVSSITQNEELTQLFYRINEQINAIH